MPTFVVTEIGCPPGAPARIEAPNDYYAVAEAAGCAVNDVCLPIWERNPGRHGIGGARPIYAQRAYMPLDGSGRQWMVEDAQNE